MTIGVGQQAGTENSVAGTNTAVVITLTAGSSVHLVVVMSTGTSSDDILSVTSVPAETWRLVQVQPVGNKTLGPAHYVADNVSAGSHTITVTPTTNAAFNVYAKEITGTSGFNAYSTCATSAKRYGGSFGNLTTGTDATVSGLTASLRYAPVLLSGFIYSTAVTPVFTQGTGWTLNSDVAVDFWTSSPTGEILSTSLRTTSNAATQAVFTSDTAGNFSTVVGVVVFLETGATPDPQNVAWTRG